MRRGLPARTDRSSGCSPAESRAGGRLAAPRRAGHSPRLSRVLNQQVHGKPLAWLDNAATTQKPQSVIDAMSNFYAHDNSNIHRGAHTLAARATDAFEQARQKVQTFLGASSAKEIVFVRGTTEGDQPRRQTYGRKFLQPGDEIVLSTLEHHANIVPWQMVAKEKGAVLRVIPVTDRGEIMLEEYQALLGPANEGRRADARLEQPGHDPAGRRNDADGQALRRPRADRRRPIRRPHPGERPAARRATSSSSPATRSSARPASACVYAKEELLEIMPPWQGGGNMIRNVTFEETTYSRAAGQVRSRHAQHRRRGGPGSGARLRQPVRPAEHRQVRARAAGIRDRTAVPRSTACG